MAVEDKYLKLIAAVFGNTKGEELLEAWQSLYGDRPSYTDGITTEEVLAREGERRFFLIIKGIMQQAKEQAKGGRA